jgi:Flp pilus assembly protein TadG
MGPWRGLFDDSRDSYRCAINFDPAKNSIAHLVFRNFDLPVANGLLVSVGGMTRTSRRAAVFGIRRWLKCNKGASAIEFAIVTPIFLLMLFGVIAFGVHLTVVHGVQQLAAEATRAAVAGVSDSERIALARSNIATNVRSYPLIASSKLSVVLAETDPVTNNFTVTLEYDASDMLIFHLPLIAGSPTPTIVRSATIQRGGY